MDYWNLIDTDNDVLTGINGADLIIRSEVNGFNNVTSSIWKLEDEKFLQIPAEEFESVIIRNVASPVYEQAPAPPPPTPIPIHDTVTVTVNNKLADIAQGRPFNIQSIVVNDSQGVPTTVDRLDNTEEQRGVGLVLLQPQFPHCFPEATDVSAGETVPIQLQGLSNNSRVTGLIGLSPVFNGSTNSSGGGTVQFPIPANATNGFNVVDFVEDESAVSAVCGINVNVSFDQSKPNK